MLIRLCIVTAIFTVALAATGCAPGYYFRDFVCEDQEVDVPLLRFPTVVEVLVSGLGEPTNTSTWAYGLIPLMPCGWQTIKSPEDLMHGYYRVKHQASLEESEGWEDDDYIPYDLAWDIAETIQYDLYSSNIFGDIRFIDEGIYSHWDEDDVEKYYPRLLLSIEVNEMTWQRHPTFYGLSVAGALGWVMGLPVSYGTCRLVLEVEAVDVAQDSTLWDKEYVAEVRCVEWIYSNWGAGKSWCAALKQIMTEMRGDLIEEIPEFEREMIRFEREAEDEPEDEGR